MSRSQYVHFGLFLFLSKLLICHIRNRLYTSSNPDRVSKDAHYFFKENLNPPAFLATALGLLAFTAALDFSLSTPTISIPPTSPPIPTTLVSAFRRVEDTIAEVEGTKAFAICTKAKRATKVFMKEFIVLFTHKKIKMVKLVVL
jgi:hypothetical protein